MSCDNLPDNGALTRGLLLDFARRTRPELMPYIAEHVAFPATMVDRITPARSPETLELAGKMIGASDTGAVECEAFRQWVIEDHFPSGRPDWQAGGALFVKDVRPYETMKLRMLNGAHSMLAYAGFLSGHSYVRDVMQDPNLSRLVQRHLRAAADTLTPLHGVDFAHYARDLAARFENPHLAHETYQIAMDGSQKMPQRIFAPTVDALATGQAIAPFAFAVAAWMRYTLGVAEDGRPYELRDPMATVLSTGRDGPASAQEVIAHICGIEGLVPLELVQNPQWREAVTAYLDQMLSVGVQATIADVATRD
jgi:fructuronate reductase